MNAAETEPGLDAARPRRARGRPRRRGARTSGRPVLDDGQRRRLRLGQAERPQERRSRATAAARRARRRRRPRAPRSRRDAQREPRTRPPTRRDERRVVDRGVAVVARDEACRRACRPRPRERRWPSVRGAAHEIRPSGRSGPGGRRGDRLERATTKAVARARCPGKLSSARPTTRNVSVRPCTVRLEQVADPRASGVPEREPSSTRWPGWGAPAVPASAPGRRRERTHAARSAPPACRP